MRTHLGALVTLALALACSARPGATGVEPSAGARYDLIVSGARVVDGTGSAWFLGDVGVRGDRIARVAPAGALA
ncbi:MAG: hypothetical protein H0V43_10515, partial [Gemmatimonadales bacterium]|nr:hypothetical protein [Gemmatimonadales bacterium]